MDRRLEVSSELVKEEEILLHQPSMVVSREVSHALLFEYPKCTISSPFYANNIAPHPSLAIVNPPLKPPPLSPLNPPSAVLNMDYVNKYESRTLWGAGQELSSKWGSTTVIMRGRPAGFGLAVPGPLHRLFTACGIRDASATIEGSRNPMQVLKAGIQILHGGVSLSHPLLPQLFILVGACVALHLSDLFVSPYSFLFFSIPPFFTTPNVSFHSTAHLAWEAGSEQRARDQTKVSVCEDGMKWSGNEEGGESRLDEGCRTLNRLDRSWSKK